MNRHGKSVYQIQVLDRVVALLDALSKRDGRGLTLPEVARELQVPKSTAHRLLKALEGWQLVYKCAQDARYALGVKLFELGSLGLPRRHLRDRAHGYLERLVYETAETSHLCILDDGQALQIDEVESSHAIRIAKLIGTRHALHTTALGKVILAHLSEQMVDDIVRRRGLAPRTHNSMTTIAQLRDDLRSIRARGYALDNEEAEEGLRCIGAPVRDFSGSVIAAVSIAGPSFRITDEAIPALANCVMSVANELSMELGYRHEAAAARA
jgi:DNA-binding IclR family transcriptional regulator